MQMNTLERGGDQVQPSAVGETLASNWGTGVVETGNWLGFTHWVVVEFSFAGGLLGGW